MAHAIETMAYAGEVPWHGLGKEVHNNLTPEEMLVEAQLDWTVSRRPVYYADKPDVWDLNDPRSEAKMVRDEKNFVVVRDSDNKVFSTCTESFNPFQNSDVMSFFKKFTEAGSMEMHTAGSLNGGEKIWGLAKIQKGFKLAGGDDIEGYLLMANSHKVGSAMKILFTPVRVVCNNTLTFALNHSELASSASSFRIPHVQIFDEEIKRTAEQALGITGAQMKTFQEQSEFLASKQVTKERQDEFIARMFQPKLLEERAKTNDNEQPALYEEFSRSSSNLLEAIETSPGSDMKSAKGTWWGAVNGVTYMVDHKKSSASKDKSMDSAWFGASANLKRRALTTALEMAKAA